MGRQPRGESAAGSGFDVRTGGADRGEDISRTIVTHLKRRDANLTPVQMPSLERFRIENPFNDTHPITMVDVEKIFSFANDVYSNGVLTKDLCTAHLIPTGLMIG